MKIFTHCPCCQSSLLNEEVFFAGNSLWRKSCTSKIDHKFSTHYSEYLKSKGQLVFIEIAVSDNLSAHWNIPQQKLIVRDGYFPTTKKISNHHNISTIVFGSTIIQPLPYFEPDFSNYPELINKLKTMIAFS